MSHRLLGFRFLIVKRINTKAINVRTQHMHNGIRSGKFDSTCGKFRKYSLNFRTKGQNQQIAIIYCPDLGNFPHKP